MDKVRALAAEESQNIEIIFISHDGETAAILGNAFAEDLGFKNVNRTPSFVFNSKSSFYLDAAKNFNKENLISTGLKYSSIYSVDGMMQYAGRV